MRGILHGVALMLLVWAVIVWAAIGAVFE